MTTTAYRDPLASARIRFGELGETFSRTAFADATKRDVLAVRAARIAFGAVGIAGMGAIVAAAVYDWLAGPRSWEDGRLAGRLPLTQMLVGSWLLAGAAWIAVRILAGLVAARADAPPAATGDVLADIARLERALTDRLDGRRLASLSIALPAAAICLLLPLTLHFVFWAAFMRNDAQIGHYDDWIALSLAIVGHAHLVVAGLAVANARRLVRMPLAEAVHDRGGGFSALGWTVLAGAMPGIVFFAVPPVLVAVTGVAFVPLLWSAMRRLSVAERLVLAEAGVERV